MEPYVCLVDDCDEPYELFRHSDDWLKHLRGHYLRWQCKTKAHGVQLFESQRAYEDHTREAHGNTLTPAQLSLLAERSTRLAQPIFTSCPLCGESESGIQGRMADHIVGHLRFLALKSLPPIDDEDEDSDASGSSGTRSTARELLLEQDPLTWDPPLPVYWAYEDWIFDVLAPPNYGDADHDGVRRGHCFDHSEQFILHETRAELRPGPSEWLDIWKTLRSRDAKYRPTPVDQDPVLQDFRRVQLDLTLNSRNQLYRSLMKMPATERPTNGTIELENLKRGLRSLGMPGLMTTKSREASPYRQRTAELEEQRDAADLDDSNDVATNSRTPPVGSVSLTSYFCRSFEERSSLQRVKARSTVGQLSQGAMLACPFNKLNPSKFSTRHAEPDMSKKNFYSSCEGPGFEDMSRLTCVPTVAILIASKICADPGLLGHSAHLLMTHAVPRCNFCYTTFNEVATELERLKGHLNIEHNVPPESIDFRDEWIGFDKYVRLVYNPAWSKAELDWFDVWHILFPHKKRPQTPCMCRFPLAVWE